MSNGDKGSTKQDTKKKGITGSTSEEGTAKAGGGTGGPPPGNVPPKPKKP